MHHAYYNEAKLALLLETHPQPLSINNLTDALDELYVPNAVVEIEAGQLEELTIPFMSMITIDNQAHFVIVKKVSNTLVTLISERLKIIEITKEVFLKDWHLIAILIEVEKKATSYSKLQLANYWSFYLLLSVSFLVIPFISNSFNILFYNLFSLVGVIISYIIFLVENGSQAITSKFCSETKSISCNAVLSSKGSKLFGLLKLSDASFLYFSTLFISALVFNKYQKTANEVFSTMVLTIIPFSIYYQWQEVKKWCKLCLATVVILLLQFLLILPDFAIGVFTEISITIAYMGLIAFFLAAIWFVYKQQYKQIEQLKSTEFEALKFKRDYDLFLASWQSQPLLNTNQLHSPVCYGNPAAALHIIAVANPYCLPCAATHKVLNKVMEKIPNDVFIQYAFFFNANDTQDERAIIANKITASCIQANTEIERKQIIDQWFKTKQLAKNDFTKETLLLASKAMQAFTQLSQQNNIQLTPAIIINGKLLPMVHPPDCLPWVLPYLTNSLTNTNSLLQQPMLNS